MTDVIERAKQNGWSMEQINRTRTVDLKALFPEPDSLDELSTPESLDELSTPESLDELSTPESLDELSASESLDGPQSIPSESPVSEAINEIVKLKITIPESKAPESSTSSLQKMRTEFGTICNEYSSVIRSWKHKSDFLRNYADDLADLEKEEIKSITQSVDIDFVKITSIRKNLFQIITAHKIVIQRKIKVIDMLSNSFNTELIVNRMRDNLECMQILLISMERKLSEWNAFNPSH